MLDDEQLFARGDGIIAQTTQLKGHRQHLPDNLVSLWVRAEYMPKQARARMMKSNNENRSERTRPCSSQVLQIKPHQRRLCLLKRMLGLLGLWVSPLLLLPTATAGFEVWGDIASRV